MKLTVITINKNNIEGLRRTINSIVNQECQDFEWIVIDGGSTDGSKELLEQYSSRMSYWISEPDKGIYNAMNKGIAQSRGEYLLFLNSGDWFYDNEVTARVIPLLQGKDFYVGNELRFGEIFKPQIGNTHEIICTLLTRWIPHQATFIKRTVFDKYGLYEESLKMVSDEWLFWRAMVFGDATTEKIDITVDVFDPDSIIQLDLIHQERELMFNRYCGSKSLLDFYWENRRIIWAIKHNRFWFKFFKALITFQYIFFKNKDPYIGEL